MEKAGHSTEVFEITLTLLNSFSAAIGSRYQSAVKRYVFRL